MTEKTNAIDRIATEETEDIPFPLDGSECEMPSDDQLPF